MDTNTNFRITIPKPCHEDWNKFTPDEKGAFCKVCSKSVHDFTKKEPEQIKAILIEEMNAGKKVCGRFNEDQITPCAEPAPALDTYSLNFQKVKRFAMALFLVFGGFLFNSVKSSAQKMGKVAYNYREPVRGEIAVTKDPEPVLKDTARTVRDVEIITPKTPVKCSFPMKGDVAIEPIEVKEVMGGVKATPVEEPTIKGNAIIQPTVVGQMVVETIIEEPVPTMGSVVMIEEPIRPMGEFVLIEEPVIKGDTVITIVEDYPMMGLVVAMPYDVEPPILIDPYPTDSIQNIVDGEFAIVESTFVEAEIAPTLKGENQNDNSSLQGGGQMVLSCYPNPTSNGFINIKYSVKENVPTSIVVYDMSGNLVKTLVTPQNMYAADYQTQFDVSDLQDGIYLCELTSGGNKTTTRIVIAK